ncbi:MAG TPA: hypothetical protein VJP85_04725 [Candidatus Baltobacteraceae bacterium]|nr:hypothetical protein [Candidatus Baltobacteraceae bacterium]
MVLPFLALLAIHSYAATPQRAVLHIVYPESKERPVVRRVNVVGSYATVLTSGGMMESTQVTEAILVQHFSFGWQPLDVLNAPCRLHHHALGRRAEVLLMRGMPKLGRSDDRMCEGLKDAGPRKDVESVRRQMDGPLVPEVIVSGDWAIGNWYGAGGGRSLWHKRDGEWRLVQGGGGDPDVSQMRAHGVPRADWCKFAIRGARCH